MLQKPEYFIKSTPEDFNEADYLRILWSPLFEAPFKTENCIVKIKTGKSVHQYATASRADTYHESKKAIGFKINIRFTTRIDKSILTLAAGRLTFLIQALKYFQTKGGFVVKPKKLLVILFILVRLRMTAIAMLGLSRFLPSRASCFDGSLHLSANGLYIAVPQFPFSLPSSIHEFDNLADILAYLLRMKRDMHRTAMAALKNEKAKHSVGFALGYGQNEPVNQRLECVGGTWFTPPYELVRYNPPIRLASLS